MPNPAYPSWFTPFDTPMTDEMANNLSRSPFAIRRQRRSSMFVVEWLITWIGWLAGPVWRLIFMCGKHDAWHFRLFASKTMKYFASARCHRQADDLTVKTTQSSWGGWKFPQESHDNPPQLTHFKTGWKFITSNVSQFTIESCLSLAAVHSTGKSRGINPLSSSTKDRQSLESSEATLGNWNYKVSRKE